MKIILFLCVLIQLAVSQPTFSAPQLAYTVDVCINNTDYSTIFRCSDYSLWGFTFPYTTDCSGYGYTSESYAGCDESSDAYYYVEGCSDAQSKNGVDCGYIVISGKPLPLGVCKNTDDSPTISTYYTCIDGNVTLFTYDEADCTGDYTTTNYTADSYKFNCGSNNCGVKASKYTTSYQCGYDGVKYRAADPRSKSCKHFIDDDSQAKAIDVCFSGRKGFELYSEKYVCTTSGDVQLWYWLDSDDCSSSSTSYLVSTYTSSNYTIDCSGSKCDHKIRYYSSCTYKNVYTEAPYVWNQCFRLYDGNQSSSIPSYNKALYYMNTCVYGYFSKFYYTDSACSDANVFYIYNTSLSGCDYELTGCTNPNSSGYRGLPLGFSSVIAMIFAMVLQYIQ